METALVLPVPEAAAVVDPWLGKGLSAHLTLTVPFLPSERAQEVAAFAADVEPFDYALVRCARFPTALYLVPEPDYPRYGGAHADVVPHVTVAEHDFDAAEAAVAPHLPIAARAAELLVLALVDAATRRWEPYARFPLGDAR